jgi:hypothetical protein
MTRLEKLESYSSAYDSLIQSLKNFPKEMWQFKPAPNKWSIHEVLIHIADSEVSSFARARKIICESGSTVMVYDENLWAKHLDYHNQNIEESLELFRMLRMMTYKVIKDLPKEIWKNFIIHPDNGKMTLDDWLTIYEEHIPVHIKQMQKNFNEWLQMQAK